METNPEIGSGGDKHDNYTVLEQLASILGGESQARVFLKPHVLVIAGDDNVRDKLRSSLGTYGTVDAVANGEEPERLRSLTSQKPCQYDVTVLVDPSESARACSADVIEAEVLPGKPRLIISIQRHKPEGYTLSIITKTMSGDPHPLENAVCGTVRSVLSPASGNQGAESAHQQDAVPESSAHSGSEADKGIDSMRALPTRPAQQPPSAQDADVQSIVASHLRDEAIAAEAGDLRVAVEKYSLLYHMNPGDVSSTLRFAVILAMPGEQQDLIKAHDILSILYRANVRLPSSALRSWGRLVVSAGDRFSKGFERTDPTLMPRAVTAETTIQRAAVKREDLRILPCGSTFVVPSFSYAVQYPGDSAENNPPVDYVLMEGLKGTNLFDIMPSLPRRELMNLLLRSSIIDARLARIIREECANHLKGTETMMRPAYDEALPPQERISLFTSRVHNRLITNLAAAGKLPSQEEFVKKFLDAYAAVVDDFFERSREKSFEAFFDAYVDGVVRNRVIFEEPGWQSSNVQMGAIDQEHLEYRPIGVQVAQISRYEQLARHSCIKRNDPSFIAHAAWAFRIAEKVGAAGDTELKNKLVAEGRARYKEQLKITLSRALKKHFGTKNFTPSLDDILSHILLGSFDFSVSNVGIHQFKIRRVSDALDSKSQERSVSDFVRRVGENARLYAAESERLSARGETGELLSYCRLVVQRAQLEDAQRYHAGRAVRFAERLARRAASQEYAESVKNLQELLLSIPLFKENAQ